MNRSAPTLVSAFKRSALAVHRWLVPRAAELGFMPYVWLLFLSFLFIRWLFESVSGIEAVGTLAALCVFLALYFRCYTGRPREGPWLVIGIAALGFALTPFNIGALVFLIYAATLCGYIRVRPNRAFALIIGMIVVQTIELVWLGVPVGSWLWGPLVAFSAGLANLYFGERERKNRIIRQSQDEIRRLATAAERERIARDLHDLLGHTLTLITVKAELAGTLAERDLPRAADEIRELEQIARDALAQVRQAVGGYRGDLAGEIANAGVALHAAGIHFDADAAGGSRGTAQDAALAMVVREAVTNIVRHAGAQTCRLSLRHADARILLELRDDGHRGRRGEGNGIRGMRERIEALGGTLSVEFGAAGTHLEAIVPAETTRPLAPGRSPEGRREQEAEVAS